jgi:Mrp family chromosome partitioning ATPase
MTALDQAIIKAYRKPAPRGKAVEEPVVLSARIARPAVPLSKALAELSQVTSAIPPVGPAIAELLADAVRAAQSVQPLDAVQNLAEVARAVVDPSSASDANVSPQVAATASAVRAVLPVAAAVAAPAAAPIVASTLAAVEAVQEAAAKQHVDQDSAAEPARQTTSELFESPGLGTMLKRKVAAPKANATAETFDRHQSAETQATVQTVAAKIMQATAPALVQMATGQPAVHVLPSPPESKTVNPSVPKAEDSPVATSPATTQTAPPEWHPMLQVDRVVWPSACARLQGTAAEALDQWVTALQAMQITGQKAISMASCTDGEGVSTLLLAAARKLSSAGVRVALVDGNMARPTLASSIGLLPQVGWENAMSGELPLEDAVIESELDHVAVLPTIHAPAEISTATIASHMATLSKYFDFVLVDLGALYIGEDLEGDPWNEAAAGIAATTAGTILVQNVRKTTPNRIADAQRQLEQAGVTLLGMIQNFVVG